MQGGKCQLLWGCVRRYLCKVLRIQRVWWFLSSNGQTWTQTDAQPVSTTVFFGYKILYFKCDFYHLFKQLAACITIGKGRIAFLHVCRCANFLLDRCDLNSSEKCPAAMTATHNHDRSQAGGILSVFYFQQFYGDATVCDLTGLVGNIANIKSSPPERRKCREPS